MIIVTAGHVDHGKTALLHALTGTHTAHLPEEKKRGLTIDLGYAYLPIEDNGKQDILGFIDVPGHQRFLSNMLAGVGGIDYALLVVSAEEGIKPQTEEHWAILQLLQFKQIMLVITKADRVDVSQIEPLINAIQSRFEVLKNSPVFVTSSQTGQGMDELKTHLIKLIEQAKSAVNKPFRYAIDRVFNVKGAGLVVTGTAVAGQARIGDELYLSNGQKVRIKGIHAQNTPSEIGLAGQRLALNLANVEKEQIQRGDWITQLAPNFATDRITVQLSTLQPLKENTVVHLYHFASHITGKVNLLNAKQAVENEEYFAEILLDEPLHIAVQDKLIIRSGDDRQTLGSGVVLEIHSPKRHKRSEARLALVNHLAKSTACNDFNARLALYLEQKALSLDFLLWAEQTLLTQLPELEGVMIYHRWIFTRDFKQQIQQRLLEKLAEYHSHNQDQLGLSKARLYRMAVLEQPEMLVYQFMDELLDEGKQLVQTRGWLHLPDHRIEFNEDELQHWQQIRPLFEATNQALWVRDIASSLAMDETEMRNLLYKAGKLGYLVPIVKDRFLLTEQVSAFAELIKGFIEQYGEISVNQLRDELQYGRKLTVQLIEYFDRTGFLRRKGNVHLLRDSETF